MHLPHDKNADLAKNPVVFLRLLNDSGVLGRVVISHVYVFSSMILADFR